MANKTTDIENYLKIEIDNSASDKGILQKVYNIKVLSKSREINLLQKLSEKKEKYYNEEIIDKLFNHYKISGKENTNKDLYLKNKYLYLTTRGVMNYLRLYHEQKKGVNQNYYDFEIKKIINYIKSELSCNSKLSVISLGAANSDKEAQIFTDLSNSQLKKIDYIPVDISNYLVHLGIIELSSIEKLKDLEVNSIIADFWDLADYVQENEKVETKEKLFGSNKKIFLILGGTFGNYTEKEFLDTIIKLMHVGDELIISLKLKNNHAIGNSISAEYDHPGDSEFLMEPLTYIPYFYGYARYRRDLLKKGSEAELKDEDDDKKFVSIIPKSDCYAPFIEIEDENHLLKKLRLAWTTRYEKESLINWIENYRSGDENKGDFVLKKHCLEQEHDHALVFLKKDWYDYTYEIAKKINDFNLADEYSEMIKSWNLEKKFKCYSSIKNLTDIKKIKEKIENVCKE